MCTVQIRIVRTIIFHRAKNGGNFYCTENQSKINYYHLATIFNKKHEPVICTDSHFPKISKILTTNRLRE